MRLKPAEIQTIKEAFAECFGASDSLWLFGSRANDYEKGGDIDLYIETHKNAEDAVDNEIKFAVLLQKRLGEQKIDMVLRLLSSDFEIPIYEHARKTGVQLV